MIPISTVGGVSATTTVPVDRETEFKHVWVLIVGSPKVLITATLQKAFGV